MEAETSEATPLPRLRGLMKLIASSSPNEVSVFHYDGERLEETHTILQSRRKRRMRDHTPSHNMSLETLVGSNRYVCFFVIQGSQSNFYSSHSLTLRKCLAEHYHDVMTTLVVPMQSDLEGSDALFCDGTGFAILPPSPILTTLLNVSQVPTIVLLDTATGQKMSPDAKLAVEWNDAHSVINAWQRGKSGLSCTQQALAMMTLQNDCNIL